MKVYVDYVLFLNFCFDFILLFGCGYILKRKIDINRLIIGSFIATGFEDEQKSNSSSTSSSKPVSKPADDDNNDDGDDSDLPPFLRKRGF